MAKQILLVDDDFNELNDMKKTLEKEGYKVTAVTNGAQALDMLESKEFALIIIDINMPTLSGYDLLRLMNDRVNHKSKTIYVSIVPKKEVCMDNIDGFVQKPLSRGTLVKEVKKQLGKKGGPRK